MPRPDGARVDAINRVAKAASKQAEAHRSSITALGRRHGWEVREQTPGQDWYYIEGRLSTPGKHIDYFLLPHNRRFSHGYTHNGSAYLKSTLEQIERFIVGVPCRCVSNRNSEHWDDHPCEGCPVHQVTV